MFVLFRYIIIACINVIICTSDCLATNMYTIVVANTDDPAVGTYITAARDLIKLWADFFKGNLSPMGVTTYEWILDGKHFNSESIRNVVNQQMSGVTPEDIIFFYYIGHGENAPGTPYPRLIIPNRQGEPDNLDFGRVSDVLLQKHAKFSLIIAEACNGFSRRTVASLLGDFPDEIRDLFLRSSGSIVMTSASPGEFAGVGPFGGLFTVQFLIALKNEIIDAQNSGRSARWSRITPQASVPITVDGRTRTPQITSNIRQW